MTLKDLKEGMKVYLEIAAVPTDHPAKWRWLYGQDRGSTGKFVRGIVKIVECSTDTLRIEVDDWNYIIHIGETSLKNEWVLLSPSPPAVKQSTCQCDIVQIMNVGHLSDCPEN